MRLTITIDGVSFNIDSTDPELLGRWMTEIFGRAVARGITGATYITAQAYPSWVPADNPNGGAPDWIADSRIIGSVWQVASPRELVEKLATQLDEAEAVANGASIHD